MHQKFSNPALKRSIIIGTYTHGGSISVGEYSHVVLTSYSLKKCGFIGPSQQVERK